MDLYQKLMSAEALRETYENILLTVKGFQRDSALKDIAPAVGPGGYDSAGAQRVAA